MSINHRGLLVFLLVLSMLLGLVACSPSGQTEKKDELIVFAAASMTEVIIEIARLYTAETGSEIITTFDSSGTLKTQIEEGATCDIFISASQKQMDALDLAGLDMLRRGSRRDLLENKVVLSVPENNPQEIHSYADLILRLQEQDVLLAMGNSDVPVGQYSSKILAYYGLDESQLALQGLISYASNVKEVTTQVQEQIVDAGIIYATDAQAAGLAYVDVATKEMAGRAVYPVAILQSSSHPDQAQVFLDYLARPETGLILTEFGFTPLS